MTDTDQDHDAYAEGRREGMATAALALACVSFFNLLGAEKGLLALALGLLAMKAPAEAAARRTAGLAVGVAAAYLVTVAAVLILFHDRLRPLLAALHQLG